MPYQANADGSVELDENPPHLNVDERESLLLRALHVHGWNANLDRSNSGGNFIKFTGTASRGEVNLTLNFFVFPVAWATRPAREYEQRIQITRPYDEHEQEFLLNNVNDEKCLLMGTYKRDDVEIIVAWDKDHYIDHASPTSCYVDVNAISSAMRDGFAQWQDSRGSLVCCFREEFLHYYLMNMREMHERMLAPIIQPGITEPVEGEFARNRIVYGAPGTGKSHSLNLEIESMFPDDTQRKRVTFYPEYVYAQLIGAYRPIPVFRRTNEEIVDSDRETEITPALEPLIDYRFVPGPLLELYVSAKKNPDTNYVLVIEELNRADAAGVFGDFFQLLDRDRITGESKFSINLPSDVADYLASEDINETTLSLPGNLYIWCTMNSADQGVMPLDAAFKRRWSFEYLPLNKYESVTNDWQISLSAPESRITWNDFRRIINGALIACNVQEDRLLGPFFLTEDELDDPNVFKNKVLMYLRDDVLRHEPEALFSGDSMTFSDLVERYDRHEIIFKEDVHADLATVARVEQEATDAPTD